MKKRDLNYYLTARYAIELRMIDEAEGGGWSACIPELGRMALVGDGETPEEALAELQAARELVIPIMLERGVELPDPAPMVEAEFKTYSGNLVLRVPRSLHARLAAAARDEGCSINKMVTGMLSAALAGQSISRAVEERFALLEQMVTRRGIAHPRAERSRTL